MSTALADGEARRRIGADLDTTFVVEAAAGTGKTTEMVKRILAVIGGGRAELSAIVAMTFTEKAAGEMKLRIREELDKARASASASHSQRARYDRAITQLEVARIGTIHSFCADLLRERPIEAGVDPAFVVAADDDTSALLERAFDSWFERILSAPPEGVRRLLRRRQAWGAGPRENLLWACRSLVDQRDHLAPWRRDGFAREAEIDAMVTDLVAISGLHLRASKADDYLAICLGQIADVAERIIARERLGGRDYDAIEAELAALPRAVKWNYKGYGKLFGDGLQRQDVIAQRDEFRVRVDTFLAAANADLAACLHGELGAVVDAYGELKQKAGMLDFFDLLIRARDLLRDVGEVRAELQRRFSHVFVDEFQDTDPLQAEIVLLLCADDPATADAMSARMVCGKLFVVGDPKQSLYRFRRADVALYERIKRGLVAQGGEVLYLSTSFRSVPGIQGVVNHAFAEYMQGAADGSQASYVALENYRPGNSDQPEVVVLPVPAPYSPWGKITKWAVGDSVPDAVAAYVRFLIEDSGWTVAAADGERVAIEARHICLLFRQLVNFGRDLTRPYTRALEARQVPHVLVGGRSFHGREEVMAMAAALRAIEYPDDELSVYATLRGPFFALGDDALLELYDVVGRCNPLRPFDFSDASHTLAEVGEALAILKQLHLGRNRRPIADTLADFLERTRAHAGIAIWPTGEQALANVMRVLDEARRFEARGATSFRNFVDWFDRQGERREAAEAPIVEEGTDGVRIMTVHKAKGLEFPIVILCDPACSRTHSRPSRYVDAAAGLWAAPLAGCVPAELRDHQDEVLRADDAEEIRIAYVAATRARDLLVVPATGEGRVPGWVDVLHRAIYPSPIAQRRPRRAPGCPSFAADTVLVRPDKAPRSADDAVAPGLHQVGTNQVVWWDPAALELSTRAIGGIRHQDLLIADDSRADKDEGLELYEAWASQRRADVAAAGQPSVVAESVTAMALRGELTAQAPVAIEKTSANASERPVGARFGTLVHAVLAEIDYGADGEAIAQMTGLWARMVGATDEERSAAATAVELALAHPLMQRAAAAVARGDCRREVPLFSRLHDGTIVDGIADLAFREPGDAGPCWIVVDYKTDPDVAGHGEYTGQVDFYVRAVSAATGEVATGVLFAI